MRRFKSTVSWRIRIVAEAHNPYAGAMPMKDELIEMLCYKSFKFSEEPKFKLVSGRMSQFYVNCKPTTLNARGMVLAGHLIFESVKDSRIFGIGGLTFGADPLAVATAFASEINGRPIHAFSIRKTQKDHGIVKWIEGEMPRGQRVAIIDDVATTGGSTIKAIERARSEGEMPRGQRVAIIDDVATTGGSTIKAIERARSEGLEVAKAVILVDRQEGGLENIRKHVEDVAAIITRDELVARWKEMKI
jgi:orotate phosphoribosyltransferase